ncbi:MAG TPA: replicative DNA helicase [Candidatus Limnocylindria bacterium]|nr:replicative DNA helicase [Candidatus Limnocylindria bacterium]
MQEFTVADSAEARRLRLPPQSLEAERAVLGAALQDAAALMTVMEALVADDFYYPPHQALMRAMHMLFSQARSVDLVTMDTELTREGTLDGIGGTDYLIQLIRSVPTSAYLKHYVEIVLEKSTLRKLITASGEISRTCHEERLTLEETLLFAEKSIFDIVMKRTGGQQLTHIREVMKRTLAQIEELVRNKGKIAGVPTGFTMLDRLLTGLHAGELVLVGARPSMGKTSFAMNIASSAARHGKSVAVFSLEMPKEQIAMRMLCGDARVNMQSVRSGALTPSDWERLSMALGPLSETRIYLDDSSSLSPAQLRSRCRRLMTEQGLDLIVVDYMQLMSSDGRTENRQLEVAEISRKLKGIALELKIPLLACAQLSRANVKRTGSMKPVLSDLRDSGSIEQDADVVMFLHREHYYKPEDTDPTEAEVIVAKQRNGPLATVTLTWLNEYTLFEDRMDTGVRNESDQT